MPWRQQVIQCIDIMLEDRHAGASAFPDLFREEDEPPGVGPGTGGGGVVTVAAHMSAQKAAEAAAGATATGPSGSAGSGGPMVSLVREGSPHPPNTPSALASGAMAQANGGVRASGPTTSGYGTAGGLFGVQPGAVSGAAVSGAGTGTLGANTSQRNLVPSEELIGDL